MLTLSEAVILSAPACLPAGRSEVEESRVRAAEIKYYGHGLQIRAVGIRWEYQNPEKAPSVKNGAFEF
jgi:hypothetical protein